MRRLFIFLFVAMFIPFVGRGYNEIDNIRTLEKAALSFCTEGKTWNYILFYLDGEGTHNEPYSYVVRGDTIIGDTTYKKLYYQKDNVERLAFMMREENHEVFKRLPDKEEFLLFDFGREDVGQVYSWKSSSSNTIVNWMIYAIDEVLVNNCLFRRYCCYQQISKTEQETIEIGGDYDVQKDYWVEGVGSALYGIEADGLEIRTRLPGITEYFVSCCMNEECMFTKNDFANPAYTSDCQRLRKNDSKLEPLHDLQGRRLTHQPQRGVYVRDGRKVVVK